MQQLHWRLPFLPCLLRSNRWTARFCLISSLTQFSDDFCCCCCYVSKPCRRALPEPPFPLTAYAIDSIVSVSRSIIPHTHLFLCEWRLRMGNGLMSQGWRRRSHRKVQTNAQKFRDSFTHFVLHAHTYTHFITLVFCLAVFVSGVKRALNLLPWPRESRRRRRRCRRHDPNPNCPNWVCPIQFYTIKWQGESMGNAFSMNVERGWGVGWCGWMMVVRRVGRLNNIVLHSEQRNVVSWVLLRVKPVTVLAINVSRNRVWHIGSS